MRGANYVPSYSRNDVQTWMDSDPAVIDRELFYATSPKSTVTWEFNGNNVTLIHKLGPDCGLAEVSIDGQPAKVGDLDTYGRDVQWNHRTVLASGLTPGKHVVTLKVTARKNPASSGCLVQVVGFTTEGG